MKNKWENLMSAPWGRFDNQSIQEKQEALDRYATAFNEWREKRIRDGKWLTKRVICGPKK